MADKDDRNTSYPLKPYYTNPTAPFLTSNDAGSTKPYASNRKIKDMIDRAEQVMNNCSFKG